MKVNLNIRIQRPNGERRARSIKTLHEMVLSELSPVSGSVDLSNYRQIDCFQQLTGQKADELDGVLDTQFTAAGTLYENSPQCAFFENQFSSSDEQYSDQCFNQDSNQDSEQYPCAEVSVADEQIVDFAAAEVLAVETDEQWPTIAYEPPITESESENESDDFAQYPSAIEVDSSGLWYGTDNPEIFASELFRSERGTIQMVVHENGRRIKPNYNKCGILVAVELGNGATLRRSSGSELWSIVGQDNQEIVPSEIKAVYFDRQGSLCTTTVSGKMVKMQPDGAIVQS